jgi:hypothetical protein
MPAIARNVLNAIYAFDPATPAALDIGALAYQLEQQAWPLRLGLLPVVEQRADRARSGAGDRRWGASILRALLCPPSASGQEYVCLWESAQLPSCPAAWQGEPQQAPPMHLYYCRRYRQAPGLAL